MFRLFKGIICLCLAMTSIVALATEVNKVYSQAQEIQIPGYTPPAPSPTMPNSNAPPSPPFQSNSAPAQPESTRAQNNMNSQTTLPQLGKSRATQEEMHESCSRFVAPGQQYDEIRDNFKYGFDEGGSGDIYQWPRDGEPDIVITFLDNTPIAVTGNLPTTISAKGLNFSLAEIQQALSTPGKIIGHIHVLNQKKGAGKLTVYTDTDNIVTKFTTDALCDPSIKLY